MRRWGIQGQLIAGLIVVILVSNLAAYAANLFFTRQAFDELLDRNEGVETKAALGALTEYYQIHRSWDGVADEMQRWLGGEPPGEREHHVVTVTDARGQTVFTTARGYDGPERPGQPIVVDAQIVGRLEVRDRRGGYNPREEQFLITLNVTAVFSFLFGAVFAAGLGWWLAARFVRRVRTLEDAVKATASGRFSRLDAVRGSDEIAELSRHFNHMVDRLQAHESARQALLADLAHELRTPVSVLQANLEMLLEGVYRPDRDRLASLLEETQLLTRLIEDLRSLSDAELGIAPSLLEPVRISETLKECLERHRPLFEERGLSWTFDLGADAIVLTDPVRLTQVVRNLLDNALKYGGRTLVVTTAASAGRIRVSFHDDGPGVRDDELEKIFERFYRSDPSRNRRTGGRGLGLAISRQFITACGGTMGAQNRAPHGLVVWFEVPARDISSATVRR
jgi:signal transduction histidine kinase